MRGTGATRCVAKLAVEGGGSTGRVGGRTVTVGYSGTCEPRLAGVGGTTAGTGVGSGAGSTVVGVIAVTEAATAVPAPGSGRGFSAAGMSFAAGASVAGGSGPAACGLLIKLDDDPRDDAEPRSGAGTVPLSVVRFGRDVGMRVLDRTAPLPFSDGPLPD
jgi:hypothetical protein